MTQRGETVEGLSLLERLLRCADEELHEEIAHRLWDRQAPPTSRPPPAAGESPTHPHLPLHVSLPEPCTHATPSPTTHVAVCVLLPFAFVALEGRGCVCRRCRVRCPELDPQHAPLPLMCAAPPIPRRSLLLRSWRATASSCMRAELRQATTVTEMNAARTTSKGDC